MTGFTAMLNSVVPTRRVRGDLRERGGVDGEDVAVRQSEPDAVVPVAAELVLPRRGGLVVLDDQPDLRCGNALHVGARSRVAARPLAAGKPARRRDAVAGARARPGEPVAHRAFADRRGLIAGMEAGRVDGVAVGADGQGAGGVGEQRHDAQRHAADRIAEARGVEHPDVGAADPGGDELRVAGAGHPGDRRIGPLLATMRGGDERARAAGSGEHDVARLVAHQQRPRHPWRSGADVEHGDAVGEVVHHPDLRIRARGYGHRLHADRHRGHVLQSGRAHGEQVHLVVRRVRDHEGCAVRRHRQWPDRSGFELHERRRLCERVAGRRDQQKCQ